MRANTDSPYYPGLADVLTRAFGGAAILADTLRPIGPGLSRVVGVAALILAVAVVFWPSLAAGLDQAPGMSGGGMSHGAMRMR